MNALGLREGGGGGAEGGGGGRFPHVMVGEVDMTDVILLLLGKPFCTK